jgi:hypothetical protein
VTHRNFIETVNADTDFARLKFEDKITATLELPDDGAGRHRSEGGLHIRLLLPPLPPQLPTYMEVDAFAEVKLHDITFS